MPRRTPKSPAYQWYPRDYMSDALVVSMTLEQEGAYRRLLDVCWLEGGLPTDLDKLWRLAKAKSRERFERQIWPIVQKKFAVENSLWKNSRLEIERSKQAKLRKIRQLAARGKKFSTGAKAPLLQSLAIAFASSTADGEETSSGAVRRPVENHTGTFKLYRKIAHEARRQSLTVDRTDAVTNISAWFKTLCAQRDITYDSDIAARAIAAVLHRVPA